MSENKFIDPWILLNNQLVDADGNIKDISKDKEAAHSYFINDVNKKTRFYHSLEEKLHFLTENDYIEKEFLEKYTKEEIKEVFDYAYAQKFRFPTYMGAFKFYNDYALKSRDGSEYLERYEDRLSFIALYHANGDFNKAMELIKRLIAQDFTPATPTLLNTGKAKRGEFVSCFLLEVNDSLNDIARASEFAMQLSKIGGGVSLHLSNLRAKGETIKGHPNAAKGVVGVAKLLDNAFRYADQMGQRQGAGAAYLNIFHPDVEDFIYTKKLNADDDIRIKTLSLGVVIPDKFFELAREDKDMYQFYPKTVFDEYHVPFGDLAIHIDKYYDEWVENPRIRKRKVNPRKLLEMIAQVQGESGYPYIMFADNVNNKNPLNRDIKFSNLCTEILQPSVVSNYADYDKRQQDEIGQDISCNLASGHMTNMMNHKTIKETVFAAMDIMNSVSLNTNLKHIPGVYKANNLMRSVGFGIMGHHGYIAENKIHFGSKEDLELIDVFFNIINYWSLVHSMNKAKETGQKFYGFEQSDYADGSYFDNRGEIKPTLDKVVPLFEGIYIPTDEDWKNLKDDVMEYGLYNSNRLAIAPNGSIGYVMSATPSITPVKQLVEERTYGNSKTYFPAPALEKNPFMYQTAYEMNKYKIIDVVATAQKHVDQGISFELCITSDLTTRDLQKFYLYAHYQGIKTLYYTRTQKLKVTECESCSI